MLVTADHTEVAVRHVGIEFDDAAGHIADSHLLALPIGIGVLVAGTDDAVGSHKPGQLQFARVVGVQHGLRDEGLQFCACCRHIDGRRLQARHRYLTPTVTVALHLPGEGQLLA